MPTVSRPSCSAAPPDTICDIKIPSSVSSNGFAGSPLTPPAIENPNPSPGLVTNVSS